MAIVFNPFTGGFDFTPSYMARTDIGNTFTGVSNATSWNLTTPTLGVATGTRLGVGIAADATYPLSVDKGSGSGVVQRWTNSNTTNGYLVIGGTGVIYFAADSGANNSFGISTSGFDVYSGGVRILFATSTTAGVGPSFALGADAQNPDVFFKRDAANVLAQRNGATAQTFNLYNTFTTVATAGEWAKFTWSSNQFRFGAVAGSSSGTNRAASWDYGDKLASATAAITVPATSGNIVFGGGVQLSNAAVTGLVAGAVAALTTATIVLYDSTGQAYRVPCVI